MTALEFVAGMIKALAALSVEIAQAVRAGKEVRTEDLFPAEFQNDTIKRIEDARARVKFASRS